tara:strand:- start:6086 stop:7354 length:1269 start_codon:yes stop_codon:yes gene_type:complete
MSVSEMGFGRVALDDLVEYPDNPREGDIGAIMESILENGQYRPLIVNARNNRILAGNHTYKALKELSETEAFVTFVDVDELQEKKIVLADNRTSELATFNNFELSKMLTQLAEEDELKGTGYDLDDLDSMIKELSSPLDLQANIDLDKKVNVRDQLRNLPLDVIYTLQPMDVSMFLAHDCGWKIGCITTSMGNPIHGLKKEQTQKWQWRHKMTFLDNEWHGYKHETHKEVVSWHEPKYATTRDAMTKDQCKEAGIEYYPLEQILEWAEDMNEVAENVIVIPKYDCIDRIPEKFVLGFSVPTTYGGTPVNIDAFKGRKVHLLGGSWKRQRAYLEVLGDDVVSLDNNYINNLSRFGQYTLPNGETKQLQDLGEPYNDMLNGRAISLALSFGGIGRGILDMFGDQSIAPFETEQSTVIDVDAPER